MAIKKVKRSVPSAQSAHTTKSGARSQESGSRTPTPTSEPKSTSEPGSRDRFFHFPEITGKVLEDIEFTADASYDVITLTFRDNTCMNFVIDTSFTVKADLLDRGQGDHRVLKKWPLMHSAGDR